MKILFKNFIILINRFRTATILSVLGLSIAFAAFMVIFMQLDFERNFDKCHSNLSSLYRFEYASSENGFQSILPRPVVDAMIASSPQIVAASIVNPFCRDNYVSVLKENHRLGFKESFFPCYAGFAKMFDFEMLEGTTDCLQEKGKVLIPESMAKRMFGKRSAINERIDLMNPVWNVQDSGFVSVGGVYRDFPANTQLNNVVYVNMADDYTVNDWGSGNYFCYVMLADGTDPKIISDNFDRNFDWSKLDYVSAKDRHTQLIPFRDLYYMNDSLGGTLKSTNPNIGKVLIVIAVLILFIACVNFTNFNTALTPMRVKNINIQKVLGGSVRRLRFGLIFESVLLAFFSFLIGVFIVIILDESKVLSFMSADLSIIHNINLIVLTGFISILLGIVAGLYPSFYVTSFAPALVLKGSFGLSRVGRTLRTFLLVFQFAVSCMLIICALFIYLQNNYMRQFNPGFDKDQIAVVELDRKFINKNKEVYKSRLENNPSIGGVAFSYQKLGAQDNYMYNGYSYKGENITLMVLPVSWNFFDVMGITKIGDLQLSESDEKGKETKLILDEATQRKYGVKDGEYFSGGGNEESKMPIVGFVGDTQFSSLHNKMRDMAYAINYGSSYPISYICINKGSNIDEVVSYIKKTIVELDPAYPVQIEFYDTFFNNFYQEEKQLSSIIYLFSILAIVISLVGVFGLVLFEAQFRKKEIGIRKVMGSSVMEVLLLLGRKYIWLVIVSFVIAVPVSAYSIIIYLQRFAYKVPVSWWVFMIALLIVLIVTVFTVVFQSWRIATANPRESIVNE